MEMDVGDLSASTGARASAPPVVTFSLDWEPAKVGLRRLPVLRDRLRSTVFQEVLEQVLAAAHCDSEEQDFGAV
jgi:hypothetical protein